MSVAYVAFVASSAKRGWHWARQWGYASGQACYVVTSNHGLTKLEHEFSPASIEFYDCGDLNISTRRKLEKLESRGFSVCDAKADFAGEGEEEQKEFFISGMEEFSKLMLTWDDEITKLVNEEFKKPPSIAFTTDDWLKNEDFFTGRNSKKEIVSRNERMTIQRRKI